MQSKNKARLLTGICSLTLSLQMANPAVFAEEIGPHEGINDMNEIEVITPLTVEETTLNLAELYPSPSYSKLLIAPMPTPGMTENNPFLRGTGESNSFRIPSLITLSDGTMLAAADARWNVTYDGGGLDTIVSRSEDGGSTWHYSYANFLGDNGNEYNGTDSTCFIDPILVEKDGTVYLLVDLYPYGVALNGKGNTAPTKETGFNNDGYLQLKKMGEYAYNYYLKDGLIYKNNSDTPVQGIRVDDHFNLISESESISSPNLFFKNAPYQVKRTSFLYLVKSQDGGKNWSAPQLLNLKRTDEKAFLVAPGRGIVTDEGRIILPTYSYKGEEQTQRMDFVYSDDGETWHRSTSGTSRMWSSESAPVLLSDSTIRFFFRNGSRRLHYVDYKDNAWGNPVDTGIPTNSNCQISAIKYSRKIDGKEVLLVSCPTGPRGRGDNRSGASYRLNGKIFVGLIGADNTIEWQDSLHIPVTQNERQFIYSCLTEQENGKLSILYENSENKWGVGPEMYYTMDFKTYDLSHFNFDKQEQKSFHIEAVGNKIYGDTSFTLAAKGGNGDGEIRYESLNPEVLSLDGANATIHKAGQVTVRATKSGNNTYKDAVSELSFTIQKKDLYVKANSLKVTQGDAMPSFTYKVEGLVTGDSFENPTLTTTAKDTMTVGVFPIQIEGGSVSKSDSYQIHYVNGSLEVISKPLPQAPSVPLAPFTPAPKPKENKKDPRVVLPPSKQTIIIENEDIPLGSANTNAHFKNPRKTSEISVPVKDNQISIALNNKVRELLNERQKQELLISSDLLTVGLESSLLGKLPDEVKLTVKKAENTTDTSGFTKISDTFRAEFTSDNKAVTLPENAKIWVSIPYQLKNNDTATSLAAVSFVDGKAERIAKSFYDGRTQAVLFETPVNRAFALVKAEAPSLPTDIQNHWAKVSVEFLAGKGILPDSMTQTLSPDRAVTREEFVSLLARLEQAYTNTEETAFKDMENHPSLAYINWASRENIVNGVSATQFAPEDTITREQIAHILTNYAAYLKIPFEPSTNGLYKDDADISDYAKESIYTMTQAGILTGKGQNIFDPKGQTTRAEVLTLLHRFVLSSLRKY